MSNNEMSKKDLRNVAIVIAVAIIGTLLPGIGPVTKSGVQVLALFFSILYGWSTGAPGWSAIVIMLIYSLTNNLDFSTSVLPGMFGQYVVILMMLCFWYVTALQSTGLVAYFAKKMFRLKITRKGPYFLMSVFLVVGCVISMFSQAAMAVEVLLFALLRQVSDELKLPKYNAWTVLTGLGIGLFTLLGVQILPFNANTLTTTNVVAAACGVTSLPGSFAYTFYMVVFEVLCMIALVAITKFIIRPKVDFSGLENVHLEDKADAPMPAPVKYAVAALIELFIVMFIPVLISSGPVNTVLGEIGICGALVIGIIIICFARKEDGSYVTNFGDILKQATPWNIVFFIAALMYCSTLLNSEETGLPTLFAMISEPLSQLSPFVVICIISLVVTALTNILNNFVVAVLFAPIGYAAIGVDNPYSAMFMLMLIVSSYLSIALPCSSSTAIFLHAEKDMFKSRQLIGYGYLFTMLFCVIALVVLFFLQPLFGV